MTRALVACLLLLVASPASAQVIGEPANPYPDPAKFARGLYVDAEAGAAMFLGQADGICPGAAMGLRFGYEVFRWAAVQLHGFGSSHATDFPGLPQTAQLLQLLQGTAELKLSVPLRQWSISGVAGVGMGRFSTNLLGTTNLAPPGARLTPLYGGGLGVDYHTASRHFSFGLHTTFTKLTRIRTTGVIGSALYLRYTF
jgi:hypothetical protein